MLSRQYSPDTDLDKKQHSKEDQASLCLFLPSKLTAIMAASPPSPKYNLLAVRLVEALPGVRGYTAITIL